MSAPFVSTIHLDGKATRIGEPDKFASRRARFSGAKLINQISQRDIPANEYRETTFNS